MKTWQMGSGNKIVEIEKEATNVSGRIKRGKRSLHFNVLFYINVFHVGKVS